MSKRFSTYVQWGIIGIWLSLVFTLVYRHYVSGVEFSPLQSLSERQFKTSEEWFGLYYQGKKIGFMQSSSEKIGNEYRFTQSGESDIIRDDKNIHTRTSFTCLTDLAYRIKSFHYEMQSGETFFKSYGELDEQNMLLVFMETGEKKKTQTQEIQGHPYLPITVKHLLLSRGLERGKRFNIPVLNIFTLKVEEKIVEVQDLIPVKVGINVNTAYALKIGETYTWVTDGGNTLKEISPSGVLYYSEINDLAQSKDYNHIFDFLSLPVFKSNKQLPYPEELSQLTVRLGGLDLSEFPLLNEGRQVLKRNLLSITREDVEELKARTYDLPYTGKNLEPFLSPTPFVQSDHRTIIYNSRKFVRVEKNAFRLARFLTSNLYLTIKKTPRSLLTTSMDVFKYTVGESNEHTVMFTAFSRAGGLPTRMVGGIVYSWGSFYYHTWPEVWLDKWVPADPTLGQFPADVTHIRLMEGDIDTLASLGSIMKKIKIDVIEAL